MDPFSQKEIKQRVTRRLRRFISWFTGISLTTTGIILVLGVISILVFVRTETFETILRNRILEAATKEIGAEITFKEAKVSLLRLNPRIDFFDVQFEHPQTEVSAKVKRVSFGISAFISLPLLFFKRLYLSFVEVEGVEYDLQTAKTLEQWIEILRPKRGLVPPAFRTSVGKIRLQDVTLNVALPEEDILGTKLDGIVHLVLFELKIGTDEIEFRGDLDFKELKYGDIGPFEGQVRLGDTVHKKNQTYFKGLSYRRDTDYVVISGEVKRWKDPIIDLQGELKATLAYYLKDPSFKGVIVSKFSVKGPWKTLEGNGRAQLSRFNFRRKKLDAARGGWTLEYPLLTLEDFQWRDGEEEGELNGTISLESKEVSVDINLKRSDIGTYLGTLNPGLGKWESQTSGTIHYEGEWEERLQGKADLDLTISNFRIISPTKIQILEVPEIKLLGSMNISGPHEGQFTASLEIGESRWGGGGSWNEKEFNLEWDSVFFGERLGKLYFYDIALLGSLSGSYKGPWERLVMDVEPKLDEFTLNKTTLTNLKGHLILSDRVLAGRPLRSDQLALAGGIHFTRGEGPSEFSSLSFVSQNVEFSNVINMFQASGKWSDSMEGKVTLRGILNGPLDQPAGQGFIFVSQWHVKGEPVEGRTAKALWAMARKEIYLREIEVKASTEAEPLKGEISLDARGISDLSFQGRKIRINDWLFLLGLSVPLQGACDIDIDYQRKNSMLKAKVKVFESSFLGRPQPDSQATLQWGGERGQVNASIFGDAIHIVGQSSAEKGVQRTNLNLLTQGFDILPILGLFKKSRLRIPVTGSGTLNMKQSQKDVKNNLINLFRAPKKFSGQFKTSSALIQRGSVTMQEVDPFTVDFRTSDRGRIRYSLKDVLIRSQSDSLKLSGYYESENLYSFEMKGGSDLRPLSGLVDFISRSDGHATIDGTFNPKGFTGKVELSEGLLAFEKTPLVMRNVEGLITGVGSRIEVKRLTGEIKEGTITSDGWLNLENREVHSAQLRIELNNTFFSPERGVTARISGPLNLRITNKKGKITGRVVVREGRFRKRIDLRTDMVNFFRKAKRKFRRAIPQDEAPWKQWELDIGVTTDDSFVVRNNLADALLGFHFTLVGTIKEPRLKGKVEIVRGQFTYNNHAFVVRSGSIQFQDSKSNIPTYEIRSDTIIDEYTIYLKLLGGPNEQRIVYTSDPYLSEKDILGLISFGQVPSKIDELRADSDVEDENRFTYTGISLATGFLQDRIEGRLAQDFGIDRFQLSPTFYDATKQTELQILVGTDIIRNRVGLNYSNFISTPGGHKVELDFRVTSFFSVIGSWEDVQDEAKDDFGGDLRFRFEFD